MAAGLVPARRVIRANRAYFGLPGAHGERDAAVLGHFGAYLGEFLGAAGDPGRLDGMVAAEQFAALDAVVAAKRSVVVVTPHLGNWEIGSWALERHSPGTVMLLRKTGDPVLDAAFRRSRGQRAVIDVTEGVRPLVAALKAGRVVAAAIDEPRDHGIDVAFLGRVVRFPAPLFRIVADAKALVLPARCRRLARGRIAVEVSGPVTDTGPRETAQAVADVFSAWIREDPDQWMMLGEFRN